MNCEYNYLENSSKVDLVIKELKKLLEMNYYSIQLIQENRFRF